MQIKYKKDKKDEDVLRKIENYVRYIPQCMPHLGDTLEGAEANG